MDEKEMKMAKVGIWAVGYLVSLHAAEVSNTSCSPGDMDKRAVVAADLFVSRVMAKLVDAANG
jgi:hypothetical protein